MKRDTDTARWPDGGLSVRENYDPPQLVEAAELILLSGKRGKNSTWKIEYFDGSGEDITQLDRWSEDGDEVETADLLRALKLTHQIIWGDFLAFERDHQCPWLVITAFDGCWFDVRSDDVAVLEVLRAQYSKTRPLDPDVPRGAQ